MAATEPFPQFDRVILIKDKLTMCEKLIPEVLEQIMMDVDCKKSYISILIILVKTIFLYFISH